MGMDPSSGLHEEMAANSLENMLVSSSKPPHQERKPRPQPEQALKCPRCESTNTKFCYYNNYSLTQPRYFCKSCRRYWTKGGTLRNVPVGGGCRKNKRSSSSSSSKRITQDHEFITTFPPLTYDHPNDLALAAFASLQKQCGVSLGLDGHDLSMLGNPINTPHHLDALGNPSNNNIHSSSSSSVSLDALRSGFLDTQNCNFQNLCYGYGNGILGDDDDVGLNICGEMVLPYEEGHHVSSGATTQAVTVTTMKQEEVCNLGRENDENNNNKFLWGFPWQINGNGSMVGDVDSGRESWNVGLGSSTWHGLLNSPLM